MIKTSCSIEEIISTKENFLEFKIDFSGFIEEFHLGEDIKLLRRFSTFNKKYIRCCKTLLPDKKLIGSEEGTISILPVKEENFMINNNNNNYNDFDEKNIFLEEEKNEEANDGKYVIVYDFFFLIKK